MALLTPNRASPMPPTTPKMTPKQAATPTSTSRLIGLVQESTRRCEAEAAERDAIERLLLPELLAADSEVTRARHAAQAMWSARRVLVDEIQVLRQHRWAHGGEASFAGRKRPDLTRSRVKYHHAVVVHEAEPLGDHPRA